MNKGILFSLLLLLCGQAQPLTLNDPVLGQLHSGSAAITPTNIPGAINRFYWDYLLMPTNVTVSNQWVDTIQANILGQTTSASRPTNSSTGVNLPGNPFFLTNNTFEIGTGDGSHGNTGSVFMVCTLITPAGTLGGMYTTSASGGQGWYYGSDHNYKTFTSPGNATITPIVSGTLLDIVMTYTNASSQGSGVSFIYYTNSLAVLTNGNTVVTPLLVVGADNQASRAYANMKVQTYVWYSNVLNQTMINSLHKWATNRPDGGNNVPGP